MKKLLFALLALGFLSCDETFKSHPKEELKIQEYEELVNHGDTVIFIINEDQETGVVYDYKNEKVYSVSSKTRLATLILVLFCLAFFLVLSLIIVTSN